MGLWQIGNTRISCHVTSRWAQGCSKLKKKSRLKHSAHFLFKNSKSSTFPMQLPVSSHVEAYNLFGSLERGKVERKRVMKNGYFPPYLDVFKISKEQWSN